MRTIFVTGAEGFVGTHLVQYLRQRGYDVVGGVRNRARKLAMERRNGKALVCDVSDAINVARAIASAKPDGIIHLAGTTRASDATDEPLGAYQSIVSAWANLLDGVRRATPRARVLLVSACDVYGNAGASGQSLAETTPPSPVSTFGSLKAAAETIAHTFFRNYHLNITIARPFHHIGPGQSNQFFFASIARRLAEWNVAANGTTLSLPDLNFKRDLLHVADVVSAYERLLTDGKPNEIYNVCSGTARTVRETVELLVRAANLPLTVQPQESAPQAGQIQTLIGDNTKLRQGLGWQPTRTIEQAAVEIFAELQRPATPVAPARS